MLRGGYLLKSYYFIQGKKVHAFINFGLTFYLQADPNVLRNRAMTNYSFYLNRYKFLIPFDIPYYSAFIASIFDQRVFNETYEKPQIVRYFIFQSGSVTKNGPPVK